MLGTCSTKRILVLDAGLSVDLFPQSRSFLVGYCSALILPNVCPDPIRSGPLGAKVGLSVI